jgi:hypothetical protein
MYPVQVVVIAVVGLFFSALLLALVGNYRMKDGCRLGDVSLAAITTAVTDALYEKLLIADDGNERRTTINHAMKSCRRAWNIASRRNPGKVPLVNPFARMGLKSPDRETPTATLEEMQAFRVKALEMGHASLATAALIAWEWLQREVDIFATFDAGHYRPKERPHAVRVLHEKTREEAWIPLFDDDGVPLYPELMGELDAIKRERIWRVDALPRLGWTGTVADMADTRPVRPDPHVAQGEGNHPCGWPARRIDVHLVPSRWPHRSRRLRPDRCRDQGNEPPQERKGAAPLRQAHHEAGHGRRKEAARNANKGRQFVRMSDSLLVRMAESK